MIKHIPYWLMLGLFCLPTYAQIKGGSTSPTGRLDIPWHRLQASAVHLEKRMARQTDKYLTRLERQEKKLLRLVAAQDSGANRILLPKSKVSYQDLRKELEHGYMDGATASYSSRLDSLQTALQFLKKQKGFSDQPEKLEATLTSYHQLQGKLSQTERMKQAVQQRQQFLQTHLQALGLPKRLKGFQKQAYYFQAQVSEYKQVLAKPTQLEQKLLKKVQQLPAFQAFFREQSQLATLFQVSSDPALVEAGKPTAGLQTITSVQAAFTQKFGEEAKVLEAFEQKMQNAEAELSQLKDKIAAAGSAADVPLLDFKPNQQKTKTFWQRLEIGTNLQSTKSNAYFPSTTDVGLSLGYKLHDKAVIGLGGSYKIGWGADIRHVQLTRQGTGLRSFLDFQLKKSFWLSGGTELHHRRQESDALQALPYYQPWQKMALLGLTKKYKINTRYQGKMQLLYDFLHQQHAPTSQAILFRVGYTF